MLANICAKLPATGTVGKIARLPLRFLPKDTVVPILSGSLRGKRWIAGAHNHSCWLGIYEPEMQEIISREVQPGTIFYDIGANSGFYSLLAALRVGLGKVFSFEPLPSNVAYLTRHLSLNNIANVEVLQLAIANQQTSARFLVEPTGAMGRLNAEGDFLVEVSTIDILLDRGRIAPPHAIKMDIEGAEYSALQGAANCFQQYRPKLFLATHGYEVHELCCELLRSWNYDLCEISKSADRYHAEIFAVFKGH